MAKRILITILALGYDINDINFVAVRHENKMVKIDCSIFDKTELIEKYSTI